MPSDVNFWLNIGMLVFLAGSAYGLLKFHSRQIGDLKNELKSVQDDAKTAAAKVSGIEVVLTSGMSELKGKMDMLLLTVTGKARRK